MSCREVLGRTVGEECCREVLEECRRRDLEGSVVENC